MGEQDRVAVLGAGIIGCAIAFGLAREGWRARLADPEEPGAGGASFGNVGHIAAELIEPLPSPALLFGFWRELFALGGALDIPWRRLPEVALWARRFAAAAFERHANTQHLAPLVRPASAAWERLVRWVGTPGLLRPHRHSHFMHRPDGDRLRRSVVGTAPRPVRIACSARGGAWVSRRAARTRGARRCADHLHGPQHPGHAHGLAAASLELHGVLWARGSARPEKARPLTCKPQTPRVPLRERQLQLVRPASDPSGLPPGDRPGARCREALLRHRPPAPGTDPRADPGRSDDRPGLEPRARARSDRVRPAPFQLTERLPVHLDGRYILLTGFLVVGCGFLWRWYSLERTAGGMRRPRLADLLIGFVTDFFDALGIGNFAPPTAVFKLQRRMPDEDIPGTLNVGHALPCVIEALIFVAIVTVDVTTLLAMIVAAVLGARLGAGFRAPAPRPIIQLGIGLARAAPAAPLEANDRARLPAGGGTPGPEGAPPPFPARSRW